MFDEKSRYAKLTPYLVTDARRQRTVSVVPAAEAPRQELVGFHLKKQNERIDHLAFKYLADPAGYWRICELNDAMLPDALAEAREVAIPKKGR